MDMGTKCIDEALRQFQQIFRMPVSVCVCVGGGGGDGANFSSVAPSTLE